MSLATAVLCTRERDLKPRTSLLPALCLASTGSRVELKRGKKKGRRMKTIVHQYRYFPQINLFPGILVGEDPSKSARNPERAFIHSSHCTWAARLVLLCIPGRVKRLQLSQFLSQEKRCSILKLGPNLITCKPRAGQEAGTGLWHPWQGEHPSLGREDQAFQMSSQSI